MGAVDSQRQEAINSSTPGNIDTPDVCVLLQLISNHHPEVLITPIMNNLTRLFRPPLEFPISSSNFLRPLNFKFFKTSCS
jgi:hypothetical protein